LSLVGITETGYRQLDFLRGVLNYRNSTNTSESDCDTTCLRHRDSGPRIALEENFLDYDGIWFEVGKEFNEVPMEISEPIFHGVVRISFQDASGSRFEGFTRREIRHDETKATSGKTWVNSHYEHMFDSSPN
jgi:hypothetical protein